MTAPPNELDQGMTALDELLLSSPPNIAWNEAETRLHFINKLLTKCLGWPEAWFYVEKRVHEGYADYVLGQPNVLVIEAKRTGVSFEIPVTTKANAVHSIPSLIKASDNLKAAMEQVIGYCAGLGIEYGAVCNGNQLVVFIAVRRDKPPLEGRALVIENLDDYKKHFALLWQNLSPEALRQRRLTRTLTLDAEAAVPPKLSSSVFSFHQYRYKKTLQADLRLLADLLINDIPETDDVIEKFYEDCYCNTNQLTQYAILSDRIMKDRYAALFEGAADTPSVEEFRSQDLISGSAGRSVAVEALAKRPIVLLGDTGVGKSSFLKNLIIRRSKSTSKNIIYLMIDLGTSGALTYKIRDFVLEEIERQLFSKYAADVNEKTFVRSIYDLEVKRFRKSIFAGSSKKGEEPTGINEHLQSLTRNRPEHLKKSISHISKGRKKQVVIVIDNADQRDFADQQEAFLAAQEIAANWSALVYISLRPQTFHASKQRGTLSAYANRVFTITPPPPDDLLIKRLTFALRIAEGQVHPEALEKISLNLESITTVLRILVRSIHSNGEIRRFIANITGGNMRQLIELFTMFIGSPNVDFDNMIQIEERTGNYIIPLHEFSKHALLGEYAHYSPSSSLAGNLFDVTSNDPREHFLSAILLSFLMNPGAHRDSDGFISTARIIAEMQAHQYLPSQIRNHLEYLIAKKLIEGMGRASERTTEIAVEQQLSEGYRITSVGAYHLVGWLGTFAYLDAMSFDTPIFSEQSWDIMAAVANSFNITDRLRRTNEFLHYLTALWHASGLNAAYFDWSAVEKSGEASFATVTAAIERRERFNARDRTRPRIG